VRQWPLPSGLADLLWFSSELAVFPDTLSPATKLTLCVCAQHHLPQIVQVCVYAAVLLKQMAVCMCSKFKYNPHALVALITWIAFSLALNNAARTTVRPFTHAALAMGQLALQLQADAQMHGQSNFKPICALTPSTYTQAKLPLKDKDGLKPHMQQHQKQHHAPHGLPSSSNSAAVDGLEDALDGSAQSMSVPTDYRCCLVELAMLTAQAPLLYSWKQIE